MPQVWRVDGSRPVHGSPRRYGTAELGRVAVCQLRGDSGSGGALPQSRSHTAVTTEPIEGQTALAQILGNVKRIEVGEAIELARMWGKSRQT